MYLNADFSWNLFMDPTLKVMFTTLELHSKWIN